MEMEPTLPPPVYAPELVARTILHAAETPERDLFVGSRARAMSVAGQFMPRSLDRLMRATIFRQQQSDEPSSPTRRDSLYAPVPEHELSQRNRQSTAPAGHNLPTSFQMRSGAAKTVLLGGALLAAWALVRRPGRRMWQA